MPEPVPATQENLQRAADILKKGGVVAIPTETVYGLAGDAFNPKAVARIFEIKKRPSFDPLIVHLASPMDIERVAEISGREAWVEAAAMFWPGPLTVVLPKKPEVPDLVSSGLPTVALRIPSHPLASRLLSSCGLCLAAPSANPFGGLSPTLASHVAAGLGNAVDLILDGGPSVIGIESTIIDLSGEKPRLLRPGAVALESLRQVFEDIEIGGSESKKPQAPGQLPSHYSPRTPLSLIDEGEAPKDAGSSGLLTFKQADARFKQVEVLSPRGDLREAAANLFACLHRLDASGLKQLYAQRLPEQGLGLAIMDRLQKAAAKK